MADRLKIKTQFDYLYDALALKYPGIKNANGNNTVFQFSQTPINADWNDGNDAIAYDIANSVSKNLDGFYVHGDALDTAYSSLIRSIKPTSGVDTKQYKELLKRIDAALAESLKIRDEALENYMSWCEDIKPNNTGGKNRDNKNHDKRRNNNDKRFGSRGYNNSRFNIRGHNNSGDNNNKFNSRGKNNEFTGIQYLTFDEWLLDSFGGAAWAQRMDQQKMIVAALDKEMASVLSMTDVALANALKKLEDYDTMPISIGGQQIRRVPRVTIGGNLTADFARWLSLPSGQYEFSANINSTNKITSKWVTIGETSPTEDHWLATDIGNILDISKIIQDKYYNLSFKAVGLNTYNITRGKWYSPEFVKPDINLIESTVLTNNYFFGETGVLHMIPNNIVVIYKPEVELTISTQTYNETIGNYAKNDLGCVEMFGFRMQFGETGQLKPIDKGDRQIIRMSSPDNAVPIILGITSTVVYNRKNSDSGQFPKRRI